MLAEEIMIKHPVTAQVDECVCEVLQRMRQKKLRMLPVLDADGRVVGIFSTFSILSHVVPEYIVSGDLNSVSYAPDIGILHKHYETLAHQKITCVVDDEPACVRPQDSLLSVAAGLVAFCKHEYVLVTNEDKKLLGIISAGDILDFLHGLSDGARDDA